MYLLKKSKTRFIKHKIIWFPAPLAPSGAGNQMLIELEVCQELLCIITCNPRKSFVK